MKVLRPLDEWLQLKWALEAIERELDNGVASLTPDEKDKLYSKRMHIYHRMNLYIERRIREKRGNPIKL